VKRFLLPLAAVVLATVGVGLSVAIFQGGSLASGPVEVAWSSPTPTLAPTVRPSPTAIPVLSPSGSRSTPTPTATPAAVPPAPTPTATPPVRYVLYSVRPGDTLESIAARFGTTPATILKANNLPPDSTIYVGQVLIIPATRAAITITPQLPAPGPTQTPAGPGYTYPAPTLTGPESDTVFDGPDAPILLSWQPVGTLAPDDYYVIHIPHTQGLDQQWTKETSLGVPKYLYSLGTTNRRYNWYVVVMRLTGTDERGYKTGFAVSPSSERRSFVWQIPGAGPGPAPPSPTPETPR